MGSIGHEEGAWRVFWAWVEGATGNMAVALQGLVEQVLSWTPIGGLCGRLGLSTSMDTLHTLLIGWLVFVVLILIIGSFFYIKFVSKFGNDKFVQSTQEVEPEGEADEGVATSQRSSRSGKGGGVGGSSGKSRQAVPEKARKPTIIPDGPRELVSPPVATGADPDAANWANNIFTWLYNSVDGGPIITKNWLETVSENTVKTALETGILVEVVEVYKVTPAPVLSNMVVDCSPNDNITITCDCDAIVYLRLITTRTQGEVTTESEYACTVNPLRGRLNIAIVTEQLMAVVKFDGWPEVGLELEGIRNNAAGLHEQSITDVIGEVVTSAVRNAVLDLNFQNVSTFPRFRRARLAPDKIIPVGYDSMVRELQTHPPCDPKSTTPEPISLHHDEELEEAGVSFTAISFAPTLSRQGVLTTSEEQLIVRNLNKYPSLENTEIEADDMSEWHKPWEENYVPAAEVPFEEPVSMKIVENAIEFEEIKEEPTTNFVLVASNRSRLIDEPRRALTIEEVIVDEEPEPVVVRRREDEPCLRRANGTARDSILATPVMEPPEKVEEEEEEDLDQPLRLEELEFVDKSLTGTSGFGPLPALPSLQKGPFVSEACSVGIKVYITPESSELEASVQTASFEPSVACDLSECDQEVPVPFQILSQSPPNNRQSAHDDLSVCPFSDAANSPDDCHVNLLPSYASTSSLELETHCASALHAIESGRSSSRENSSCFSSTENRCKSFGEGGELSQDFIIPGNAALIDRDLGENEADVLGIDDITKLNVDLHVGNTHQEQNPIVDCSGIECSAYLSLNCCPEDNIKFIDDSESESPFEGECSEKALAYMYSSEENEEERMLKSDLTEELIPCPYSLEENGGEGTHKKMCLNEFTDSLFRHLELEESELALPEENVEDLSWEIAEVYETKDKSLVFTEGTKEGDSEETSDSDVEARSKIDYDSETESLDLELKTENMNHELDNNKPRNVQCPSGLMFVDKSSDMVTDTRESDQMHNSVMPVIISTKESEQCSFEGEPTVLKIKDDSLVEYFEYSSSEVTKSDTSEYEEEDDSSEESPEDCMAKLSELSDTLAETDDEKEDTLLENNVLCQKDEPQISSASTGDYIVSEDCVKHQLIDDSIKASILSSVPFTTVITEEVQTEDANIEGIDSEEEIDFEKIVDLIKEVKEADGDSAVVEDLFSISESQIITPEYSPGMNFQERLALSINDHTSDQNYGFQSTKSKFLMGMLSSENLAIDPHTFFDYRDNNSGLAMEDPSIRWAGDIRQNMHEREFDVQSASSSILSDAIVGNSTDSEEEEMEGSLQDEQDIVLSDETNLSYDHNWRDTDIDKIAEVEALIPSEDHPELPLSFESNQVIHTGGPIAVNEESLIPTGDDQVFKEKPVMSSDVCQMTETNPAINDDRTSKAKSLLSSENLPYPSVDCGREVIEKSHESDDRSEISNNVLEFSGDPLLTTEFVNVDALTQLDTTCALTHQQGSSPYSWNQYNTRDESPSDSSLTSGWPQWSRPLSSYPVYGTYYVTAAQQSTTTQGQSMGIPGLNGKRLLVKIVKAVGVGCDKTVTEAYAVVEMDEPPQKFTTAVVKDTSSPFWDEQFLFDLSDGTLELLFELYDKTDGNFLGLGIVGIEELVATPSQRQIIPLQTRPYEDDEVSGSLTVEFLFLDRADLPDLTLRSSATSQSLSSRGDLVTTTTTTYVKAPESKDVIVNGGDGVAAAVLRDIEEKNVVVANNANKSTMIIHASRKPGEEDGYNEIPVEDLTALTTTATTTTTTITTSLPQSIAATNSLTTPTTTTATTTTMTNDESIDPTDIDERGRSRGSRRKRDSFFGTLKKRFSRSKVRSKSMDPGTRDISMDRDPSVGRSISMERAANVRASEEQHETPLLLRDPLSTTPAHYLYLLHSQRLLSVPASAGGDGGSTRSSISDTSAISSSSTRTYVNEASTLIVETSENGILKHFLIPLALQQKSKWRKKGLKLHVFGEHTFIAKHMPSSTPCQVCQKTLGRRFGKQGYECRDCGFKSHKPCHVKTDTICPNSTVNNMDLEYVKDPREERRNRLKKLKST